MDNERVAKYVAQQRAHTIRQASAGEQISKQQEEVEKQKKHEAMRMVAWTSATSRACTTASGWPVERCPLRSALAASSSSSPPGTR